MLIPRALVRSRPPIANRSPPTCYQPQSAFRFLNLRTTAALREDRHHSTAPEQRRPRNFMMSESSSSENSEDSWTKRREEARWNRFSTGMDRFHSWFKMEFNQLYELADGSFNKHGMSLSDYISSAEDFTRHLTMHHNIEEARIFPFLATRMPAFAEDEQHKNSHKAIHDGLDNLKELITRWRGDNTTYSPADMRGCLDGFKDVLMAHLDEEVEDLKAENMKKYWKLEELDVLPF